MRIQLKLVKEVDVKFLFLRGKTREESGEISQGLQHPQQSRPVLHDGGLARLVHLPINTGDGEAGHEHAVLLVGGIVRQHQLGAESVGLARVEFDSPAQGELTTRVAAPQS